MFTVLLTRPITWIIDFVRPPQIEETAEQLEETSLDDQAPESSSEMPRVPTNVRHEGHHRVVSESPAHPKRREHRPSGEEQSQSRFQAQATRLTTLEKEHRQLVGEHKSLEENHHQLSEKHRAVITKLHETHDTCKKQQEDIKALKGKLSGTSALLDVRNQELKVAKTFLSKEDPLSTSDVVQSVRDLNSEIMQIAAHLAENLPLKRDRAPLAGSIPEGPCKPIFITLVLPQGFGGDVDAGSVELALQGFLAVYAGWIANTWGFSQASGLCDELYSKVYEMEDHTVAGNWRVLTRRTLSRMDSSQGDLPRQIVNDMIKHLADHLSACGVGGPVDNANNIHKYARDRLGSLFTAAQKLNKMIGETVISDDLKVIVVGGGDLFDGERMEDAYPRRGTKPVQRSVICTTDLGLCESKGGVRVKTLLTPKVALHNL